MNKVYLNVLGLLVGIILFATALGSLVKYARIESTEDYTYTTETGEQKVDWKPVVVKKKYTEQSVTKDIVFGTGNWYDVEHYIVSTDGKLWTRFSKEDYILCDVGDTLWTKDGYYLQIKK